MKKASWFSFGIVFLLLLTASCSSTNNDEDELSETVRIALRDVGNQLLLIHNDSTSLIMPVKELSPLKYELSFELPLSFMPNELVTIVDSSFQRAKLPSNYRVEVVECVKDEVAYSYQMSANTANTIIPCAGRTLPTYCYTIQVRFTNSKSVHSNAAIWTYLLVSLCLLFTGFLVYKRRKLRLLRDLDDSHAVIGSFLFYPDQHKLIQQAVEINLSKKECELLSLFVANPNQVISREELTKRVWEDNGVIVGRSLDTYISKLRKKLQGDDSIKITNVHGIGYKLEV
ncbi:MAG: winged helix-turn-helix domain-containing protein [Bacteroidetes bacterium]|nr:winged helix-turn-helix domain-containing protein [Bacteroidota bacterium]